MRRGLLVCVAVAVAAGLTVVPAVANWQPADGHKMHSPQLPNEAGWDVNATRPIVLADDWRCSESGYVKDIHFWGSWLHGADGQIVSFNLSIHADIPADPPTIPYSRPGATLWEKEIPIGSVHVLPITSLIWEGWYDPSTGAFAPNDHNTYYQYNVFLNEADWFTQNSGTIYWLNISATVLGAPAVQWGWKSTLDHWNDDAVWAQWGMLNWVDIKEPPMFVQSLDLSFVINGGPPPAIGACCYSDQAGANALCVQTTQADCIATYNGVYQGDGIACGGTEGCCLPDGSCITADALCCVNQLGGTPQGPGTACAQTTIACCLPDGTCLDIDSLCCDDIGGTVSPYANACRGDADANGIDDACELTDTCTYYKSAYPDYAPSGMPDFDQKQDNWKEPVSQAWSHCGPVALADCFWWFDSKFDTCTSAPPKVCNTYPLIDPYGLWDDHNAQNVIPYVDTLAKYCKTNQGKSGTNVNDLAQGAQAWLDSVGLTGAYTVNVYAVEPGICDFAYIRNQVLASQDVILLLGFWQDVGGGYCERIGGHFVTVAGTCVDPAESVLCISDPYLDKNEGDPPPGSAHGAGVHNDAQYVSGPHGTMHHDRYHVTPTVCRQMVPPFFTLEFPDYGMDAAGALPFKGQNQYDPGMSPIPPQPGIPVHTIVEFAVVICPVPAPPKGACCYPVPGGGNTQCIVTTADSCANQYGGVYQGDGSACGGIQACCLPNGDCIMADSLCCVNELSGVPQGTGSSCTSRQACCMPDGSCRDLDPLCCVEQGGIPQGPFTQCTAPQACCMPTGECRDLDPLCCTELGGAPQGSGTKCSQTKACCLPNGNCTMVDPLCCDELGGYLSPYSNVCLGDGDQNGIDDACEPAMGACCLENGACAVMTDADCVGAGGEFKGDGTKCLGDVNGNGIDDACDEPWQPGNPHKMHYPQLPDLDGWDVWDNPVLADDWQCSESGPVKDIHFWGSWMHGTEGKIAGFQLAIFSDIPAAQSPTGYSVPGALLWQYNTANFNPIRLLGPTLEGWYEPQTPLVVPGDHGTYFQYDIYIPEQNWFRQEKNTIYWLSIAPILEDPALVKWGWKSSANHFNDDAVWSPTWPPMPPMPWYEMLEPPLFQVSLDLAFVITGGIVCDCNVGDANNDTQVNVGDAVYMINFVFKGGPAPKPYPICSGDANCDCLANVGDAVYLINYVFKGGPPPCTCQQWLVKCGPPLRK